MEFIRWPFLWVLIQQEQAEKPIQKQLKTRIAYAAPSMAVLLGMIVWRLIFFDRGCKSMRVENICSEMVSSPLRSLISFFVETARDFIETAFIARFVPAYDLAAGAPYRA